MVIRNPVLFVVDSRGENDIFHSTLLNANIFSNGVTDMKTEVMVQWADALRSGRYEQTKGQLRDGDKFCVLGVLCDLAPLSAGSWGGASGNLFNGHDTALPHRVEVWADMAFDEAEKFVDMNDSGRTFEQIAKVLDERLDDAGY